MVQMLMKPYGREADIWSLGITVCKFSISLSPPEHQFHILTSVYTGLGDGGGRAAHVAARAHTGHV